MKNFQSTVEGTWTERVNVPLTPEQRTLLASTEETDAAAQATLRTFIRDNREVAVSEEKAEVLVALYADKKPVLKVTDTYQLIAMNVSENELEENDFTGILNCRVNEEHIQVRF